MRIILVVLLCTIGTSRAALADYALRWSPTSGTSSGPAINVDLFLDETAPDTNLVYFGAVGVSYVVNLTGVGSLSAPVGNPGFDSITPSGSGTSVSLQQTSISGLTDAGGSLKIGSFTINQTVPGLGQLAVALFGSGADFSVYDNDLVPQVLDGQVIPAAKFDFEFTAVPEPSSLLIATSLACLGVWYRRRRKKPISFLKMKTKKA